MDDKQIIAEAAPPEEGKFCADCKYLIGVRHKGDAVNWNCGHPKNDKGLQPVDLVTGIRKRAFLHPIYELRSVLSEGLMCGKEGNWYEKYTPPEYKEVPLIGGAEATEIVFDEATLAAGKEAAQRRLAEIRANKNKPKPKLSATDLDNL